MLNVPNFGFRLLVCAYAKQYTLATTESISDAEAEDYLFKERARFCPCDVVEEVIYQQMMLANVQCMIVANRAAAENPPENAIEMMNRVSARLINLIKSLNAYRKVYTMNPRYKPIDKLRPDREWSPERAAQYDADDREEYARHWQPENHGGRHEGIEALRHEGKSANEQGLRPEMMENAATNKDGGGRHEGTEALRHEGKSANEQGLRPETMENAATNKDAEEATQGKGANEQGLRPEMMQNAATNKDGGGRHEGIEAQRHEGKSTNEQGSIPQPTQNAATNKDAASVATNEKSTNEVGLAQPKLLYPLVHTAPSGTSRRALKRAAYLARKKQARRQAAGYGDNADLRDLEDDEQTRAA